MPPTNPTNPTPDSKANLNQTLISAGSALGDPKEVTGYRPVIIVPEGFKATPLEHETLPPLPDHIRQKVALHEAASFISYVNTFKDADTRVFSSMPDKGLTTSPEFRAIFDYHLAVAHKAQRCAHAAHYTCPLSLAWMTWAGIHGKAMTQREFVDFVDENMPDIVTPKAADVMELARDFNAHTEVKFASKVNAITGGVSMNYQEDTEVGTQGGQIEAFDRLALVIPVFEGGDEVPVDAKVQWVPKDGKLAVTVKLYRPSETKRTAFLELRREIQEKLGIAVLNGGVL